MDLNKKNIYGVSLKRILIINDVDFKLIHQE
jgi:hypothetical protein